MTSTLSDVRVLDLSRVLAGPWATQIFADLGADVIKVERVGSGDDARACGPPFLSDAFGKATTESVYYTSTNRNKRSIAIDFTSSAGQELVRTLAAKSDVLVENFKVGELAFYGLDFESLRQINPRLIYCFITGFGQSGPHAHKAGYDFAIQAVGSLMSITGLPDGEPGGGPQKEVGVALTDVLMGLYASTSVLAALHRCQISGVGQYIDLSLLDAQLACLANQVSNYLVSGQAPGRLGNAHPNIVPYQDFRTSDGHMIVAVGNDAQYRSLCSALNRSDLALDERFLTNRDRVENRAELVPLLQSELLRQTTGEWLATPEKLGNPCARSMILGRRLRTRMCARGRLSLSKHIR